MKIVHITYVLSHGGVGTLLGQIANRQVADNEVEIIVLSDIVAKEKIEVLDSKVKVILLNRHTGSASLKPIFRLNQLLAKSNADIYHFHEGEIVKYLLPCVWWRVKKKSCVKNYLFTPYEIIQNSPNGIVVVDKSFNITEINAKAKSLLGIH